MFGQQGRGKKLYIFLSFIRLFVKEKFLTDDLANHGSWVCVG